MPALQPIPGSLSEARGFSAAEPAEALDLRQLRHLTRNALQRLLIQADALLEAETSPAGRRLLDLLEQRVACSVAIADALFGMTEMPGPMPRRLDTLTRKTVALLATPRQRVEVETRVTGLCPGALCRPVLRMAHEAVANAVKHGFAQRSAGRLMVWLASDAGVTTLEVLDDGRGPAVDRIGEGLGLIDSIAATVGGVARLRRSGGWTRAEMRLPHDGPRPVEG
ncbi:sensor histidine kinase family protein [Siccirubricoccus phaeus]|uniref:sensor histidine kinase n=1 Tax=Siccirubricoccus phaeus TaxID=2595053 RepID=UPI0011F2CF34|nr:sensor histidine kinase [Siccirubricoccus phaeus]